MPEKLQMPDNRQETTDTQSQAAQQMQDLLCTDRNETENAEIIEKMVCGLHNLQIGDSTPMPLHLSKLEKQVNENNIEVYLFYKIFNISLQYY